MGFRRKFTIVRKTTAGYYDENGDWIEGSTSENIIIQATVQPLNSNDQTEVNPDGERTTEIVKVYTSTRLLTAKQAYDENNPVEADVLLYDDREWKIIKCSGYQSGVISHYKAYAQEVTDGN